MQAQRVKVGVIADTRQHRHDYAQRIGSAADLPRLDRVFGLQVQVVQVRQHAEHRFAGVLLQPPQPRFQQRDVATETVDDKAPYPGLL